MRGIREILDPHGGAAGAGGSVVVIETYEPVDGTMQRTGEAQKNILVGVQRCTAFDTRDHGLLDASTVSEVLLTPA
jgi:hypothetical protein